MLGTTSLGRFQLDHSSLQSAFILCVFKEDLKCINPWRLIEILTEIDHRVGMWAQQHITISHRMLGLLKGANMHGGAYEAYNKVFKAFDFMAKLDLSADINVGLPFGV